MMFSDDLNTPPAGATLHGVTAETGTVAGRPGLCLSLDPALRRGVLGVDFGDQPTFLLLPITLQDGVIEVDLLGRLLPDAPDYARGFIGVAYRVQGGGERFEAAYLRPTNGRALSPPPPRGDRAVQVFAYPDWLFDRLRAERPGVFEAGADILPDRWHHLRLDIDGQALTVSVDGVTVLRLTETLQSPAAGRVGLWVDIGTEGWFANLRVTPRASALTGRVAGHQR
jgi:hypothetical protein